MSRLTKWMSSYWDMMMKHATWSEFPELAHELYHPGVRAVAQEETPEVVTTLVDATLEEQMPE